MNKKLREHKSNVFALLFNDKKEALKLYNAVNGTHYENYEDIKISTLIDEDGNTTGITAKMKNDVSFIFESSNNFYEHQSTVNENMPLRFLLYLSEEIKRDYPHHMMLKRSRIKIPAPVFIVFYNGDEDVSEQYVMKLSEQYEKKVDEPALELTVRVYNINKGHNKELLSACISLGQFAEFTERCKTVIKTVENTDERSKALMDVINECIKDGILPEFLNKYKEAIMDNYLVFTQEDYDRAFIEDLQDDLEEQKKTIADLKKNNEDLTKTIEDQANTINTLLETIDALRSGNGDQ